jgi:uncharacterized protein YukE
MTDAATEITLLANVANVLEYVRDQLEGAVALLGQAPPPTLWWGAARREYEAAAAELSITMQQLRSELQTHAQEQRHSADALAATQAATTAVSAITGGLW